MRVLKLLFLSLVLVSQITVYASYAPVPEVVPVVETPTTPPVRAKSAHSGVSNRKDEVYPIIEKYAQIWAVDVKLMDSLVYCESGYNRYALNDNPGVELSSGLAQINLLAHNVTREQAEDPEFALNFMAKNISEGKAKMWYNCYKKFSTGV